MTSSVQIGEFLKQKAGNMQRWLKENGNLIDTDFGALPAIAIVQMAQELLKYESAIVARDFDALLADPDALPVELAMTVGFVRGRTELHDKFWRYLRLFSDTVK